jgi:hypothetical protein
MGIKAPKRRQTSAQNAIQLSKSNALSQGKTTAKRFSSTNRLDDAASFSEDTMDFVPDHETMGQEGLAHVRCRPENAHR